MKKVDLKTIQRHLLGYLVYLKSKSLAETKIEESAELEVEIMSIKSNIHKIEQVLKG